MARKSYDRMYREYDRNEFEKNNEEPKKEVELKEEIPEEKEEDVVKEEKKATSITGTVIGGASLNVRNKPNGDVINSIKEGTNITIVDESNPEWFKIESPEGYVMKKFVRI